MPCKWIDLWNVLDSPSSLRWNFIPPIQFEWQLIFLIIIKKKIKLSYKF